MLKTLQIIGMAFTGLISTVALFAMLGFGFAAASTNISGESDRLANIAAMCFFTLAVFTALTVAQWMNRKAINKGAWQ
jgi:hypothetical protein